MSKVALKIPRDKRKHLIISQVRHGTNDKYQSCQLICARLNKQFYIKINLFRINIAGREQKINIKDCQRS